MAAAVRKGVSAMESKIVKISSKRQITIPQKFYALLDFDDEAECTFRENELVIRPVRRANGGEFAEQILADLIQEGLSGSELLARFKEEQAKVRPAIENMLDQAAQAANDDAEYESYDDVFGAEE